jgi:hypothetical protein
LIATDGKNLHRNGLSDIISRAIKRDGEEGDPYVAVKGGEGEAADVTVSRLLECWWLLNGLGSHDGGSNPLLLLLGSPAFSDLRRRQWNKEQ